MLWTNEMQWNGNKKWAITFFFQHEWQLDIIPVSRPDLLNLLLWGRPGYPGVAELMDHKQEQMASS